MWHSAVYSCTEIAIQKKAQGVTPKSGVFKVSLDKDMHNRKKIVKGDQFEVYCEFGYDTVC